MYFSCHVFSVTRHQIVKVAIVANLVYIYLTRGIENFEYELKWPEIGGSYGAICLSHLVLHHTQISQLRRQW